MSDNETVNSSLPGDRKNRKVIAKAELAGKANKKRGSLVKCEVNLEKGDWISPNSCATFKIDADARFPALRYEIQTDEVGPYQWSWELKWNVRACPQRRRKARFRPKHETTFSEKGTFSSESKFWDANLNDKIIGGQLTVKVKAGKSLFIRKTFIVGTDPGEDKIFVELDSYKDDYPHEAMVARKIFRQETNYCHFYSDEQPLVSFDNGYGLGQATTPVPTFEEVWNWKKHVQYIVTNVIKAKRTLAKKYLDQHGNYSDDDLDMETLVYYNGANYHYLIWSEIDKKWRKNDAILCDPDQSNTGWDLGRAKNKNKTLKQLRGGEGEAPKYTGRCYAEHVKNN